VKQHKKWFDEECLCSLDQRNRAKMQWLELPAQSSVDKINNVRHEASTFQEKKRRNI